MSLETRYVTALDFEAAAEKVLSKQAYDYFRSGADEERTLKANRKAFRKYVLWPRVLVDVSVVSTAVRVLGTEMKSPLIVAPTAYHRLAHPDGEVETAVGAARAGVTLVLSTLATRTLEDVAKASGGRKWFQLYVHNDRGFTKSLIERADAAGFEALVLTVDAPILGRRLADERNSFVLPEGVRMENLVEPDLPPTEGSALSAFAAARHDASLSWADIEWIRSISSLPLVIKGILRSDDALTAADLGVDAIVVSNHGGRQLDGAPAAIDALDRVSQCLGGRIELMMDGGIRFGTDILKALALGARAVLIGRPVIWGLAVGGAAGVARVLDVLRMELIASMQLAGCSAVEAIDRTLVEIKS